MPRNAAVRQTDFSGGVNIVAVPYKSRPNQVIRIRNLLLEQHGGMNTRDGFSILTSSPIGDKQVLYEAVLNKSNGTSYPYVVINDGVDTVIYLTDTSPWTLIGPIPTGNSNAVTPQSSTMLDTDVVVCRNFITPAIFDGATITSITSGVGQTTPPGAQHCIYHLGALWLWNTSPATTALDGPSSLRQSDINNYNSWPNSFQTFVGKNDGQQGMGMATYTIAETGISPTQTLLLFKNFSSYQVTGTFGASNFAVQRVKSDMGCIAPRTIQFLSGFGVMRLSHKGFSLFNGVDDVIVSEEIRPLIFGDPENIYGVEEQDQLDFANANLCWSAQTFEPLLYMAAVPILASGGHLFRFFVYDLVRKAWTVCDYDTLLFSTINTIYIPGTQPVVHGATVTNPVNIVDLFNHKPDDNGTPIPWSFTSNPFYFQSYLDRSFFRRCNFDVQSTSTSSIDVTAVYANQVLPNQTVNIPILLNQETRVGFSMIRKASSVYQLQVSGTGVISIRGIEIQGTTQPLTIAMA